MGSTTNIFTEVLVLYDTVALSRPSAHFRGWRHTYEYMDSINWTPVLFFKVHEVGNA